MSAVQEIDAAWLRKIGASNDSKQLKQLEKRAYDVFEARVGTTITQRLTDEQLDEFEILVADEADADTVIAWLEKECQDYKQIVQTERAMFRRGILRSGDKAAYILRQKG